MSKIIPTAKATIIQILAVFAALRASSIFPSDTAPSLLFLPSEPADTAAAAADIDIPAVSVQVLPPVPAPLLLPGAARAHSAHLVPEYPDVHLPKSGSETPSVHLTGPAPETPAVHLPKAALQTPALHI